MTPTTGTGRSPGAVPGPADTHVPSRKGPSPLQQWWRAMPGENRKQITVGGLILVYLLVLGVGGWYNVSVYIKQNGLAQQIASYERELARMEQIRRDTQQEQARHRALQTRSAELYARFPDVGAVPVIVGQLEQLAMAAGGAVTELQYAPPLWNGPRGRISMRLVFTGPFKSIVAYVASVGTSVPTLYWDSFDIQPVAGATGQLQLFANIHIDVLKERPPGAAPWRDDMMERVDAFDVPDPFETPAASPPAQPWPDVQLLGIVQQQGQRVALLTVDRVSHVLRAGQQAAGVRVADVTDRGVVLGYGRETMVFRLAE